MIYEEKFKELKKLYDIDENCQIIINKGENQVVYQIVDENENQIWIDFNLIEKTFVVTFDFIGKNIFSNPIEEF